MPKPATRVRSEAEIIQDLKKQDLERRQKAIIEAIKSLEEKYELRVQVSIQYTDTAIVPRFILVDTKGEPVPEPVEEATEVVEEVTEEAQETEDVTA